MTDLSRPVLRYHGGKWKLSDWIISYFPVHRVYVEPFGGAGSVLLKKPRSYGEVYNDLDGEIVNVFTMTRDRGEELCRALELTPFSRTEFAQSYVPSSDPLEQARRTVLRSFQGFGSAAVCGETTGFRACSNRSGTTPAHDWRNYPKSLKAVIQRLQGVVIEQRNAVDVMLQHDSPETLYYVDPPYVHSTRSAKVRGTVSHKTYKHEMTNHEHMALADVLHSLQGAVVLSGYASELYKELYSEWRCVEKQTHADGARKRIEVLWLSPACVELQIRLFA